MVGMKVIRIENSYYDKVKALSDSSGQSLTEAGNSIVATGLGELESLGHKVKAIVSDEDIIIRGKRGATKKGKGEALTEADVAGTEGTAVESKGENGWVWYVGLLIAALALAQNAESFKQKWSNLL